MNKNTRAVGAGILAGIWVMLTALMWFGTPEKTSLSERRELDQMPEISLESILDGSFVEAFNDYTLDQFPERDLFRKIKAIFHYNALIQLDNNGYFVCDGYIAKQTYPLVQPSVNHAASVINNLYEDYLKGTDCKIYMSIVPDKGYYLATELGYPSMDYNSLFAQMKAAMPWATHLDITDTLDISDYYRTDTHWKQENLIPTADKLCQAMGAEGPKESDYTKNVVSDEFYGVYYGHAAMPIKADTITLLESDLLNNCKVKDYETGKNIKVYDNAKLSSDDMYEVYLSGAKPFLTIENPNATTDKELILFRDSFGSSIAPLFAQGYKSVTLVDVRYLNPDVLGNFITFENQDVLFLYSTLVLNESSTMKK